MHVPAGLTWIPGNLAWFLGNLAWFPVGFHLVWLVPAVADRSSPVSRASPGVLGGNGAHRARAGTGWKPVPP